MMPIFQSHLIQFSFVYIVVPKFAAHLIGYKRRKTQLCYKRHASHVKYLCVSKVINAGEKAIVDCEVCEETEGC